MKSIIIAAGFFALTAAAIVFYPHASVHGTVRHVPPPDDGINLIQPVERPRIEVVFVLDTTGSMSGLIQAAKDKIWSIASTMASAQPAPEIRMGLVAYRDRGDAYVTRVIDLSDDLDSMYATLLDFEAAGGGDGPESVNQALFDAVNGISWSQDDDVYQVVFLVGDAPPHMDYQDDVKYPVTLAEAARRGIVVNTIRCGNDTHTEIEWRAIAAATQGAYFTVDQSGGAIAMTTPFDAELAGCPQTWMPLDCITATPRRRQRWPARSKQRKTSGVEPAKPHWPAAPRSTCRSPANAICSVRVIWSPM